MSKIIEYIVLQNDDKEKLSAEVNVHIQEGWQPFGSPCQSESDDFWPISQAMVRYEAIE